MTGSNLLYEVMTGSYERVLATPLDRSAILVGRALKEFAPLLGAHGARAARHLLSGMMLPLEAGPGWMQVAARFNPLTYMVDAERVLFAGRFDDAAVLWGVVAAAATCVVGLVVGIRTTRRVV
ncbi:hypothetical protein [Isoptericola variabilis]